MENNFEQNMNATATSCRQIVPLPNDPNLDPRPWLFELFDKSGNRRSLTRDASEVTLFRDRLLSGLSAILPGGTSPANRRSGTGIFSRRYPFVRRACDIARQRVTENLSTTQLARETGVTVRSLQRGFADVLGIPAFYYLQACRLHAVRRELRNSEAADTSVARVALRYGFTELGRFSGRYRRMFGELPSHTLRRRTNLVV